MADLGIAVGIIGGAVGILSPIVGWGVLVYQNGKSRGSLDTAVKADIAAIRSENTTDHNYIKASIDTLNKTIGNGGVSGLKGEIHQMQVNCAKEMTDLKGRVNNLEDKGNGHKHPG
jgi:hypothetical protein